MNLFTSPSVRSVQQSGALQVLAVGGAMLSDPVKSQLADSVQDLRKRKPTSPFFVQDKDIRGQAAEAYAALTNEATRTTLVRELLSGDSTERASCARIIGRFGDKSELELLLVLAGDTNDLVRHAALSGLTTLFVAGRETEAILKFLKRVLKSEGRRSGVAIVSALVNAPSKTPAVSHLLSIAEQNVSAQIRVMSREKAEG